MSTPVVGDIVQTRQLLDVSEHGDGSLVRERVRTIIVLDLTESAVPGRPWLDGVTASTGVRVRIAWDETSIPTGRITIIGHAEDAEIQEALVLADLRAVFAEWSA